MKEAEAILHSWAIRESQSQKRSVSVPHEPMPPRVRSRSYLWMDVLFSRPRSAAGLVSFVLTHDQGNTELIVWKASLDWLPPHNGLAVWMCHCGRSRSPSVSGFHLKGQDKVWVSVRPWLLQAVYRLLKENYVQKILLNICIDHCQYARAIWLVGDLGLHTHVLRNATLAIFHVFKSMSH